MKEVLDASSKVEWSILNLMVAIDGSDLTDSIKTGLIEFLIRQKKIISDSIEGTILTT